MLDSHSLPRKEGTLSLPGENLGVEFLTHLHCAELRGCAVLSACASSNCHLCSL